MKPPSLADVVSPLRRVGDAHPARCSDSAVTIPPGYGDAIQQLGAGGWVGISAPQDQGGQGLPELGTAACEMGTVPTWLLRLSLSSAPVLRWPSLPTRMGASIHLPRKDLLGWWSGTMNLTESEPGPIWVP